MAIPRIPTIDLSSILKEGDEDGKKKVIAEVGKACLELGIFQVINHGLPVDLMRRARDLSKDFFDYPIEEKLKYIPRSKILPAGYSRMDNINGCNERLLISKPELGFNVFPDNLPQLRETMEGFHKLFQKLGLIVESMLNQYLGLPVDFLKKYNDDRSKDVLLAWLYPPANDNNNKKIGKHEHLDDSCISFVLQDEVGGLEAEIDGKWIPIIPVEGALVVNLGTVIQVLTNKRMMASRHRVLQNEKRSRQSFVYFYTLGGDKWIEPLPEFSRDFGEAPKYKGFFLKELLQARIDLEINPPGKTQDLTDVDHYEIKSL